MQKVQVTLLWRTLVSSLKYKCARCLQQGWAIRDQTYHMLCHTIQHLSYRTWYLIQSAVIR